MKPDLRNVKKTEDLQRLIIEKLVDIYEKDDVYEEQINFQDGLTVILLLVLMGLVKRLLLVSWQINTNKKAKCHASCC